MICNLFLLLMVGGCILSFSPCQPLHAVGYPFDCPKHRLSNTLSQHQSNSQAELSKPTRDFKISKRKTNQKSFWIHPHILIQPIMWFLHT